MKKITLLFILLIAFNWQSSAQLTEGFEGGVVPPTGWASFENGFGAAQVWQISTTANSGSNSAYIRYDATDAGQPKEDWLVTSAIDLTGVSATELSFYTRQAYSPVYNSVYQIRVSTNSQTTPGDFTTVQTWTEATLNTTYNVYEEKVVNLSAYDGMTIYIAFVHTNDDGDNWYIDDINVAASSTCNAPGSLSTTNFTGSAIDLSWGSVALEVGGYDWAVMNDGEDPDVDTPVDSGTTATGITTDTASGLSPSTNYDLYVRTNCSGGPTAWSATYNFATGPVNDSACSAIDLTSMVGTPSTGGTYNNFLATTETNEPSGACWSFSQSTDQSVWFKFTTAGAEVTLTTNYSDGTATDTVMALYSASDCGDMTTFTEIACNDDVDGSNYLSEIVTTLAAGTYYLQVDTWGTGDEDTFDIGYFDPSLSNQSFEEEVALSYFPNPVKNKLTLKAQQNIQNVSVFNMLGQEVMRTEMNVQRGELDMSSLQSGPYFVKVRINDTVETLKILKK
ncbi:MAG: choice-of-anchor J domain-containing protein [Flavobacteriaceae bacterium]|nr:choice-of-anchor J domain-containing protein [Flavobacteriaceae bacterium]